MTPRFFTYGIIMKIEIDALLIYSCIRFLLTVVFTNLCRYLPNKCINIFKLFSYFMTEKIITLPFERLLCELGIRPLITK